MSATHPSAALRRKFRRYVRAQHAGKPAYGVKVRDVGAFRELGWIAMQMTPLPLGVTTTWFVTDEGERQLGGAP